MPTPTTAAIAFEFAAQPAATVQACTAYFADAVSLYAALADLGETLDAAVADLAREGHCEPIEVWDRLDFYLTVDDLVTRFTSRTVAGRSEFSPYRGRPAAFAADLVGHTITVRLFAECLALAGK